MHPRSRMTASLFTTTLMVSFLVVAAPHLIPCPVDPRTLADSADPTRRRRRRRVPDADDDTCSDAQPDERMTRKMIEDKFNPKRECPIPKPGGLVGQVLGMTRKADEEEQTSITKQVARSRLNTQTKDDQ
jgi:cytochrome c oxidase assembly factor 2